MDKPEALYHYTSLEGLTHILSSRKIRFSRLDLLDDMTEGSSTDPVDWRKYYFVSCWTSDPKESIPLWHMYTKEMCGVRIKLPTEMFKKHSFCKEDVPSFLELADTSSAPAGAKIKFYSYLPYEELHGEDYFVMPTSFNEDVWPFSVIYTDDESVLNRAYLEYNKESNNTKISTHEIAKYKSTVWSFQKEWRFRINCFNAAPRSLADKMSVEEYHELMINRLRSIGEGVSREYFYLDISDDAFSKMEIVLGPKMDEAQKMIVSSLVDKYSPSAKTEASNLSGKVR